MGVDAQSGAPPSKDARRSNNSVFRTAPKPNRRRAPRAYASLFAPDGRRRRWMLTYVCPHCGFGHRALARSEQAARMLLTRGACGRLVVIRIARTYRGREDA
ncbi:hypothetical protein BJF79_22755 [Actinomadura sp. CNU-125]|nr:hypothetical protein BJF79_22755 [Actinomadura sp. CNU-125]